MGIIFLPLKILSVHCSLQDCQFIYGVRWLEGSNCQFIYGVSWLEGSKLSEKRRLRKNTQNLKFKIRECLELLGSEHSGVQLGCSHQTSSTENGWRRAGQLCPAEAKHRSPVLCLPALAGLLPQKTLRKGARDCSSVAQQLRKVSEARSNLAGCGSDTLEHGFKLFISSLCAGLLLCFCVINGALLKKWMLSKTSEQKRHGKSWAVVNIHRSNWQSLHSVHRWAKKNKYNHKALCLSSYEVKLLIALY